MRERVKIRLEENHVSIWPQAEKQAADDPEKGGGTFWRPPSMKTFLRSMGTDPYTAPGQEPTGEDESSPESVEPQKSGITVTCDSVWRTFHLGAEEVHACQDISLEIQSGEMVALKGRSGSGKTTLLNLLAGLDDPSQGVVILGDKNLAEISAQERVRLRRSQIGFVYQTFGLLPYLSAGENVEVPLRMIRASRQLRKQRVEETLSMVGLLGRIDHRTYELSGGEQQRVAIARALVNSPALLLADEPTGQLDSATGANIIKLLRQIATDTGVTVIIASHDPTVHEAVDRIFELKDGHLLRTYGPGSETSEKQALGL
jgi:putative ABC transport system ATP-binding protein